MLTHEPAYMEWLTTLSEGDEVAYDNSPGYSRIPDWNIAKIMKITPTGQFRMSNNELIDKKGRKKSSTWNHGYYIMPVTDEIRAIIERGRVLRVVNHTKWADVPTATLQQIEKVLEGAANATVS